jgi:cytochrome c551/c552
MKKYIVPVLLMIFAFCSFSAIAADEKPVFKALNCGICHKADTGKAFPSLVEITKAYNGDKEKLINYLQGKGISIVNIEKSNSMEKYIEKTKALSQEELNALADFIISNK